MIGKKTSHKVQNILNLQDQYFPLLLSLTNQKSANFSPTGPHISNDIKVAVIALYFKILKSRHMLQSENALVFPCQLLSILVSGMKSMGVENYHGGGYKLRCSHTKAQNLNRIMRHIAETRCQTLDEIRNSINDIRVDFPVSPSTV